MDLMLANVQLILLFDVYNIIKLTKVNQFDDDDLTNPSQSSSSGATSVEREVQTELHPVPYHKDDKYVWNLWDHRRKAIELVGYNERDERAML